MLSQQLGVPDDVRGTLLNLVNHSLVPVVSQLEKRPQWGHYRPAPGYISYDASFRAGVMPLLTTHDPNVVLAFRGERTRPEDAEPRFVVALPVMPNQPARWLDWFLTFLRENAPSAFPERTAWREDPAWSPPGLRAALAARAAIEDRRRAVLDELERDAVEVEAYVDTETNKAHDSVWRLVTAQGSELEDAVVDALSAIGFDVERRDVTDADGQRPGNLEDLRLTDPSASGWVALVELKGVAKGAPARGITQLMGRPLTAFIVEHQREPGGMYFIVNHNLATPPDDRFEQLQGDPALDLLADRNGALIDTRDLLRAHLAVLADSGVAEGLRASIRAGRGRWTYPAPGPARTTAGPAGA